MCSKNLSNGGNLDFAAYLKICSKTTKEDFAFLGEPRVLDLARCNQEKSLICASVYFSVVDVVSALQVDRYGKA